MSKFVVISLITLSLATFTLGCRNDGGSTAPDLSAGDGSNMDLTTRNYTAATPHDIDLNTTNSLGKGTAVKLTAVYVTTPVIFFKANSGARCDYEAWVQDTACTQAPCGLVVISRGPAPDSNGNCLFSDNMMLQTALKGIKVGDFIDVEGVVDTFASQGGSVVQHEVEADTVTKVTGSGTPMVFPINDGCASFVNNGMGFITHESTLVKCSPAAGKLTVALDMSTPTFVTTPGNAKWGLNFEFNYRGDAMDYPGDGAQFASITGVATALFGGQITPRLISDFVP